MKRIKPHQQNTLSEACPCTECPPEIEAKITVALSRVALLARRGFWSQATHVFHVLRDECLNYQPTAIDPFDVSLGDTLISAHLRHQLESIGVCTVGLLAHVPHRELNALRVGAVGRRQLKGLAKRYGIQLRTD